MPASLAVEVDGRTLTVDLTRITALDALVYRQATGLDIDPLIASYIQQASTEGFDETSWRLADRGILKWLAFRQTAAPDVLMPAVLATETLFPGEPPPVEAT